MSVNPAEVRAAVRAAALKLSLRPDLSTVTLGDPVDEFVSIIALMASGADAQAQLTESRAGPSKVETELTEISKISAKLSRKLKDASPSTIRSLWNAPTMVTEKGELYRTDVRTLRQNITTQLDHLHSLARSATPDHIDNSEPRGNRANLWVRGIVTVSAWHFSRLTGREVDQSRAEGGFYQLLSAIFVALGITADVERAVKDAISRART